MAFQEPLRRISRDDLRHVRRDARLLLTSASPRGWHRIQTMLECPQKFAWSYRYGREGFDDPERIALLAQQELKAGDDDREPLIKGTLVHLGLAHYYARLREVQNQRDPEIYLEPAAAIRLMCEISGPSHTAYCDDMTDCVHGYIRHYAQRDKFKILHVEELMDGEIGGYRFTGRLDLVVEDSQGRVWVFDHKTTGRIDKRQSVFYSVSGQLLGYTWLARKAYGERFAGLRINLIQNSSADYKYERPRLQPTPHLSLRFVPTIIETEQRIEALDASGRPYDEWPVAMNEMTCYGRYGPCDHMEKCQWGPIRVP